MRNLTVLFLLLPALLLVGCGGGGSSSSSAASTTPPTASGSSSSSAPASSAATNSSSASSSSSAANNTPPAPPQNTVTMTVDGGPAALQQANPPEIALNTAYISVTICVPGTSQCQSIDHIQVDTGSSGFRVISSVLTSSMLAALPAQTNSSNSLPVQECLEFADGYVFGPVVTADLKIGAETAASVPIQVIGGSSSAIPKDCVSGAMGQPQEDTVQAFGANGILGVSTFIQDCGQACATQAESQGYYTCSSSGRCTSSVEPLAQQVANPVASFATDNNGVVLQLPAIGANGASAVSGTLIFGIGTQSNNTPGSGVAVLTLDGSGSITTTYKGTAYNQSFIDSGSNAFFFSDSSITQCPSGTDAVAPGFYCPMNALSLSATNTGNNPDGTTGSGPSSTVNFSIGNALNLFQGTPGGPQPTALDDAGGTLGTSALNNSFDFGLPFFYGRTIFFALEGANTPQGVGPYDAY